MVKKLILLFLAFALLLPLAGCGGGGGGTTGKTTQSGTLPPPTDDELRENMYDETLTHRPTLTDMAKVKVGMPFPEVVAILGKPHQLMPLSSMDIMVWYTLEGTVCRIPIALHETLNQDVGHGWDYYKLCFCEEIWFGGVFLKNEDLDSFLDAAQSHKPTAAQIKRVRAGMKYADAIALIGSPHACEMVENDYWFYWFTDSGEKYGIQFVFHENEPMSAEDTYTMSAYFSHAYIRNDPKVMQ